jgi:hypothetical protein
MNSTNNISSNHNNNKTKQSIFNEIAALSFVSNLHDSDIKSPDKLKTYTQVYKNMYTKESGDKIKNLILKRDFLKSMNLQTVKEKYFKVFIYKTI